MSRLLHLGEVLRAHAQRFPERIGARDLNRSMSFRSWNERACRLANALAGLGLAKGERVAVLAYNCVEWLEIYVAAAKAGVVVVPINFRLAAPEIRYIVEDAGARAVIVQDALIDPVATIRPELAIPAANYVHFGSAPAPAGFADYEALLAAAASSEPAVEAAPDDPWTIMYTSGTTGKPKGAVRTHANAALLALVTALDMGFSAQDNGLLVMPLCHGNSLFFLGVLIYCGAGCIIYDRRSFDPEHLLATLSEHRVSFTSLVPTHYIMILSLAEAVKARHRLDGPIKLLISSAPARRDTKLAIMAFCPEARLFEGYGSTEAGWVTLLRPDEQLTRLGSIGRELTGCGRIRLLDAAGADVAEGEVGELHSLTPYTFSHYWGNPEKTAQAFRGAFCTVGDLARRDEAGYYYLVDRKSNMIISGGENVYPSEVENALGAHPAVQDVAVIGVPDDKWGEHVHAVVVLHEGAAVDAAALVAWCRERIAGYKLPRSVSFIEERNMPRTATGKILHRTLRERYGGAAAR